ncbi:MAG: NYN domain-containing protein [Acidimicrobiia bacterium]
MDSEQRKALRPAVSAARHVLDDLESDDIPRRLLKVARSSARTLPPPLESSLLETIESDETFRRKVMERWEDGGNESDLVRRYLEDPSSVASQLDEIATGVEIAGLQERLTSSEARVTDLERDFDEAKRRIAALRIENEEGLLAAKAADKRARASLEASLRAARAEHEETLAEVTRLAEVLDEMTSALEAAEAARDRARAARPTQVDQTQEPVDERSDPLGVAAKLDQLERNLRPYRTPRASAEPHAESEPIVLPPGLSPDSPDAVRASLLMDGQLVIDGYNLGGLLAFGSFASAGGREAVLDVADRIGRQFSGQITVVFDAADVDGRGSFVTDSGIRVEFSLGETADDHIVAIAAAHPGRTIVCTNDRELGIRCGAHDAVILWNDAIVAWLDT